MSDQSATLHFQGQAALKPAKAESNLKPHETAIRGWASWLAISVTALLLIQALTGLWVYLAPFSIGSQLQVLVHVAAGIASVLPYLWYQFRHWLAWRGQKLTAEMALGYLLMVMVLACMASGSWLAWQAAIGPRISRLWDLMHLVSGLGSLVLVVIHLLFGWLDIYVANDVSPNCLFRNVGGEPDLPSATPGVVQFWDLSAVTGTADFRGSMGLAAVETGDMTDAADGLPDLFYTNWLAQENALYQSMRMPGGNLEYRDRARHVKVAEDSLEMVGWG